MAEDLTRLKIESSERDEARKGAKFLDRAAMLENAGLFVTQADGEIVAAEMPPSLLHAMKSILTALAETGEVFLLKSDPEISPEKAAEILGISRPLVYQRMDSGKLPFRLVGRHRRVLVDDVMTLKRLEDRRRGLADAFELDTEKTTGPATNAENNSLPSSSRAFGSSDIDQLVLGTTNAPYRRTMSSTDLVARITSRDWRNWIAHVATFFTEVRPELVLEFAQRHAIPIQDLAASYESMKSTTGESNPALEKALERLA
ncbi:helix-turn-helix domain-containing protein [Bradyrhizobium sp. CCGB12]|uniref:helix-turn-helix domain-containing protein n=1 Tax=Bradyrhizobium sp. CCGB12 TaxID=2949632 RepID=UPI0020B1B3AF|nr:helix-turn-helix domain-containing protein [Bradyrhizobium sp. CCGB12]MCP3392027.1 helix-turn-helix domain-containing protein [Bradyrhizobium sp. CCGB12]